MQTSRVRGRGFSLIELLIVMVIIAILVLVAIPAISNYRSNARVAAVQSDVRNAGTAAESYFVTHDFTYPAVGTDVSSWFPNRSAGVVLSVAVSSGDTFCVNGSHSAVSGNTSKFYYSSTDTASLERGVHAGTCQAGTGGYPTDTPTGGAILSSDGTSLQYGFNAVAGATSYKVSCTSSDGGAAASGTGPSSPVTVTGLTAGKAYSCSVASSSNGSVYSDSTTPVALAAAPSSFSATTTGATAGVTLSWFSTANVQYEVQRSTDQSTYAAVTTVTGTGTTVTTKDMAVNPATTYYYRVRQPGGVWATASVAVPATSVTLSSWNETPYSLSKSSTGNFTTFAVQYQNTPSALLNFACSNATNASCSATLGGITTATTTFGFCYYLRDHPYANNTVSMTVSVAGSGSTTFSIGTGSAPAGWSSTNATTSGPGGVASGCFTRTVAANSAVSFSFSGGTNDYINLDDVGPVKTP